MCSKLLTGFDAPVCQVLYIDKELKEHGLIVDYRGLIQKLDAAMAMYSGAGLENFDGGDLKVVVVDVLVALGQLRDAYTNLVGLFDDVQNKEDAEAFEVALADEKKREDFYNLLCAFGRALNLALNSEQVYAAISKDELKRYDYEKDRGLILDFTGKERYN